MWHRISATLAVRAWHWTFLALDRAVSGNLDRPRSEILLRFAGRRRRRRKIRSIFDPLALAHYHAAYEDPLHIHAMCEDYRAGAPPISPMTRPTAPPAHKIGCPMLALWGTADFRPMPASIRSAAGATGPPICAAMRSKAGITCRRRIQQQRRRACCNFSAPEPRLHDHAEKRRFTATFRDRML